MAKKIVSWAVLLFLFVPLVQSFGQLVQARMLELGETIWPRYAEIRISCIASDINSLEKVELSASDSALLDELDLGSGNSKPSKEENVPASSVLTPMELTFGQKLYCGTERKLSTITIFAIDYIPMTMVILLLVAGIVSTTRRYHIALKNPENRKEELASEISQIVANLILVLSASYMLPFSKGVEAQIQVLWIGGLLFLTGLNVNNIRNSEFKHLSEGQATSRLSEILLAIPLYCWMALICGIYFTLIEHHPAGLAIYLQKLTAHATLYIQIGLYVWTGILLRDTSLGRRFFDLLKPWKLPAELLAVIVVIAAALPTAYSGASGIVVLALGATIFVELRRAGASQERALAATAMSGSLGVVLPPCLLVVIVASLNLDVTTDELFHWGWRVFGVSTTLFLVVSWFLRKGSWKIQPETNAIGKTWAVFKPFSLYILIAVVIVFVLVFGLNTHFDEHTAPYMLPIAMLALIYWDHKQSQKEHHPASAARDVIKISRTSYDTGSHLGALLMLMGLSACMGGVFERSNVINLFPTQLGSPLSAMIILTFVLVIIGMLMDPYGAVILVSVTLYPIAKANGIHPLNFWMTALVSFELGYLTPPVALNHLLTKHVVREYLEKEPNLHHESFFSRYERVIVPIIVLFLTLIVTAFGPLLYQSWNS
ncbi:TRAP transporter large permease subunit [Leptospira stimsonii]|uniref:TRAP transporter large permease subunit n=1 Tax=Leptospira stimsonii TaxID=2202203 RepID=A0ABY2MY87_9LEPT|nr:TRAP transporter large permease subunit [Leptospira stimsonii]TGK14416.1 TRAP transporter large permease subunit [Leptospira stimsonii]TGM11779.1 TRAP transporter large permease subunit [Leptospira stimsonii]